MPRKKKLPNILNIEYSNVYYRLTPKSLRNYWAIWWFSLSLLGVGVTYGILGVFGETFPPGGILAFWGLFLFFPILNFVIESMYQTLEKELPNLYVDKAAFLNWFSDF